MLRAVIWDVDGTIAETEQHGHRVAFNEAFRRFGVPVVWSEEHYRELLAARSGGKERMRYDFARRGICVSDETIAAIHREKTKIFAEILACGRIPLRAGVRRLIEELAEAGIAQALATTMHEDALAALLRALLPEYEGLFTVRIAGDMVRAKKPDPEVYEKALVALGVAPSEAVAIEDSEAGLIAARRAGLACVVTYNEDTKDQDFSAAQLVVASLDARSARWNPKGVDLSRGVTKDALEAVCG
ncbi:MAG: HAD family hydrolase [Zetaproteobacteria bacterium]|nr:MAG: HAD family hydrolase [Zetaproteobacteria bacterium]